MYQLTNPFAFKREWVDYVEPLLWILGFRCNRYVLIGTINVVYKIGHAQQVGVCKSLLLETAKQVLWYDGHGIVYPDCYSCHGLWVLTCVGVLRSLWSNCLPTIVCYWFFWSATNAILYQLVCNSYKSSWIYTFTLILWHFL